MKVKVMVTGVGGGGHGEQILKALRLASTEYEIVGSDMSPLSKGLQDIDYPYILPPASDRRYIDSLLAVCRRHGVQALFHGSEPELKAMSANRLRIEAEGIFLPINPHHVINTCMDKFKTYNFLKEHNLNPPRTERINSKADILKVDYLPVVIKPSIGGGGSANIFLAQNQKELKTFGEHLLDIYPEFIVQQYVGTPDSEYTVGVLISMDGELINSIAVKRTILSSLSNRIKVKNRTGNPDFGDFLAVSSGISQGQIDRFPKVTEPCEAIALKMGCRGSVNIQCRFVDNKVYIFEINPRFSGTTSLRAMVGYNEPDVLIRKHLLHENIKPRFSYQSGYILRGLEERYIAHCNFPSALEQLDQ